MPFYRSLPLLLVFVSIGSAAQLRTLKNETFTGELVSVSDKEIVFAKGGTENVTLPVLQVVQIDLVGQGRIPTGSNYIDVELMDGSLLHCSTFVIKGNTAELTMLLTGQVVKAPVAAIYNVLTNAQDEKYRKDWTLRLKKKRTRDVVALLRDGVVNPLEGTFGEAAADGSTIPFSLASDPKKARPFVQGNIHGMIFIRAPDPKAPSLLLKLTDEYGNVVVASSAVSTPTGLTVTTQTGLKLDYTTKQIVRMDYSQGKLTYLSDLTPTRVNFQDDADDSRTGKFVTDRSLKLEGKALMKLKGELYPKGLALLAPVEVEYDLGGDYREFRAMVGIDDDVGGSDRPTILKIDGDGKELLSMSVSRKDKVRAHPVNLNVKDVQKLRITVTTDSPVYWGIHIDLADAKVSK
jgi:hypothetical protein